eukprot:Selendium_serpulae@DN4372_c0_g1_i2.p1
MMLTFLADMMFECAVATEEGSVIEHEEFQKQLMKSAIFHGAQMGITGSGQGLFADFMKITVIAPTDTFSDAMTLVSHVLHRLKMTEERINVHVKSHRSAMVKQRRSGRKVMENVRMRMRWKEDSIYSTCSMSRQEEILEEIVKDPSAALRLLTDLHSRLFASPDRVLVHLAADTNKLPVLPFFPLDQWRASPRVDAKSRGGAPSITPTTTSPIALAPGTGSHSRVNPLGGSRPGSGSSPSNEDEAAALGVDRPMAHCAAIGQRLEHGNAICIGLSSVDSAYLALTADGVWGYQDAEWAPMVVMCEYFSAFEGPLYHAVRGGGSAYSFEVWCSALTGTLEFRISKSTEIVEAFCSGMSVLRDYADGRTSFEEGRVFEAKASTLFSYISNEETVTEYAVETLEFIFKQVSHTHNHDMLRKVQAVTVEDLKRVATKYLPHLTNFSISKDSLKDGGSLVLVTNYNKMLSVLKGLKERAVFGEGGCEFSVAANRDPYQTVSIAPGPDDCCDSGSGSDSEDSD